MKIFREALRQAQDKLGLPTVEFGVEHPKEEAHGDYASNAALMLFAKQDQSGGSKYKNPRELAEKIVEKLKDQGSITDDFVEKIEVAGAGFINFYLKHEWLLGEVEKATKNGYGGNQTLQGQKIFVEYTDTNPFKEMHIGHLMSNTIGESLARVLLANGAEVKRACYQGDVGLHVAKSIWGLQKLMGNNKLSLKVMQKMALAERQKLMGQAYAEGATKYEKDEKIKKEIQTINRWIYESLGESKQAKHEEVMELYRLGRQWSLEYFEKIYQRLGTKFDEYFFESETGPVGLKVVEEGLAKGVLEEGKEGAIIYRGEKDGLHTRVFRNKLGLPTYEAKDLGLAKTKDERYRYDKSYIVTGNEITEYFRVVLRVMEQLYPELRAKTSHVAHGMMKLTTGKMSSRTGKVITGEGLLDELKKVVITKMGERAFDSLGEKEKVADQVAVGALKYEVLKQDIGGDLVYEPEKMTNLEGNTGSYLQYTYARAKSVLRKKKKTIKDSFRSTPRTTDDENKEERTILRWIYRYPEVVVEAGEKLMPSVVAGYVYELAGRFNSFYNKHQILGNEERIELTQAVANLLKSGLGLLGIEAPEEM